MVSAFLNAILGIIAGLGCFVTGAFAVGVIAITIWILSLLFNVFIFW